jgi:hypothetical protein
MLERPVHVLTILSPDLQVGIHRSQTPAIPNMDDIATLLTRRYRVCFVPDPS